MPASVFDFTVALKIYAKILMFMKRFLCAVCRSVYISPKVNFMTFFSFKTQIASQKDFAPFEYKHIIIFFALLGRTDQQMRKLFSHSPHRKRLRVNKDKGTKERQKETSLILMSLFAYVLTCIRVLFDPFTRFTYASFLHIFWFAYLRAALYENKLTKTLQLARKSFFFFHKPKCTTQH